MGEIKSTLDLVMEKTKGLVLTDAEKEAQAARELQNSIAGLIQKYWDGKIKLTTVKEEIERLSHPHGPEVTDTLKKALLARVALEGDNEPVFELLREACGVAADAFPRIIDAYRTAVSTMSRERAKAIQQYLADTHHISGTAVVPNLPRDPDWVAAHGTITDDANRKLSRAVDAIMSANP